MRGRGDGELRKVTEIGGWHAHRWIILVCGPLESGSCEELVHDLGAGGDDGA